MKRKFFVGHCSARDKTSIGVGGWIMLNFKVNIYPSFVSLIKTLLPARFLKMVGEPSFSFYPSENAEH